jgi:oligopeptidase B
LLLKVSALYVFLVKKILMLSIKILGQVNSETRILATNYEIMPAPITIIPRLKDIEYDMVVSSNAMYFKTNARNGMDFQVITKKIKVFQPSQFPTSWDNIFKEYQILIPSSENRLIQRIDLFSNHLVCWIMEESLQIITITNLRDDNSTSTRKGHSLYSLLPGLSKELDSRGLQNFNSACLLFSKSSFVNPTSLHLLNMNTFKETTLLASTFSKYDSSQYEENIVYVPTNHSSRTKKIPLYIVRRKNSTLSAPPPLLLSSYGAYGSTDVAKFSTDLLPLLDRGISYALCHPRGDADMGRDWYKDGKYEKKSNTFIDTKDCIDFLIKMGYTESGRVGLIGRSAGGLVAGTAINEWGFMKGDLSRHVRVVISQVPFIDPVRDMVDKSMPWVPFEW